MYTTYHTFTVILIKDLINKDGDPTTPFKLVIGTKPSVSNFCVLFCPHVVQKYTTHVGTKLLNMRDQTKTFFCNIFVEIPQRQKGYLVCVTGTRKIISSFDVF